MNPAKIYPGPFSGISHRKRCSEKGCDSMASSRGWCEMHYKRWQLWGDPSVASRKLAALEPK